MKQGLTMIWTAVVWVIWKTRNAVIFDNGAAEVAKVVDEVKLWSWKWWLGRVKPSACCLLYEWIAEPLICEYGCRKGSIVMEHIHWWPPGAGLVRLKLYGFSKDV
ncbi:hypothetical protein A2U01_0017619, partial [Trifolium medium]|nr:hypothetical protein [Trifolium medium]